MIEIDLEKSLEKKKVVITKNRNGKLAITKNGVKIPVNNKKRK